jgi:hypothetical protein
MDELIQQLDQLTANITDRLNETIYQELETFVEERQKLVDSIGDATANCPPTIAQKQRIYIIMEHDSAILARMDALRLEAQDWLQKRNQAKTQRSAYDSAYSPESILMDRKK